MAVAFDAVGPSSSGAGVGSGTGLTWTHTATGSNLYVIVGVAVGTTGSDAALTASATYAGAAMTPLAKVHSANLAGGYAQLFGLAAPPSGAQTATVSLSAAATIVAGSISLTGVDPNTPVGTPGRAYGRSSSAMLVLPGTISGNRVVDIFAGGSATTSTNGVLRWSRAVNGTNAGNAAQGSRGSSGGDITVTYALPTDEWALIAVEVLAYNASGVAVQGATASGSAQAAGGSVTAVGAGSVGIAGATATASATASGGAVIEYPTPIVVSGGSPWKSDLLIQAIRSGGITITYSVSATLGGKVIAGASNLQPVSGTITDTTKPGARRTLNLTLAPSPGLYDALKPMGTLLTVTALVRLLNRQTVSVPMGVFDVDSEQVSEGGGAIQIVAPDKWQRIKRAAFVGPTASNVGQLVTDQIATLVRGALGNTEQVVVTSSSRAVMNAQTWTGDRAQAIIDLAESIGVWVFFDRNGICTVADMPSFGGSADWLIDASVSGVLVSLSRQQSRTQTSNLVAVSSSNASSETFPTQYAWDNDPQSATYAGPDPIGRPDLAGPFGVNVYNYSTSIPLDVSGAASTAGSILAKTVGLASQVSLTSVPNPGIDAFDVIDVLPPVRTVPSVTQNVVTTVSGGALVGAATVDSGVVDGTATTVVNQRVTLAAAETRFTERHFVDTVTHNLDVTQAQQIDGRSTRTDSYT